MILNSVLFWIAAYLNIICIIESIFGLNETKENKQNKNILIT